MEISIFIALHAAAAILWMLDSRAIQYLRGRSRYMRQFKKHEKAHKLQQSRINAFDLELTELMTKGLEEIKKEQMDMHPAGAKPDLSQESKEILNRISRYKNQAKPTEQNKYITWDEFKKFKD